MNQTNCLHLLPIAKGYISTIYLDKDLNPIHVVLMNGGPDPDMEYHIAMSIAYTPNFEISQVYCFKYSSDTPFMVISGEFFENRMKYLKEISNDGINFIKREYYMRNPLYSDIGTMFVIAFIQVAKIDMILSYNNTVKIQFLQTKKCIELKGENTNTTNVAWCFNYGKKVVEVFTSEARGVKTEHDFVNFSELLNNHPFKKLFTQNQINFSL